MESNKGPYIIDRDDSGHWFCYPESMKKEFDEWLDDIYSEEGDVDYEKFNKYALGGSLSNLKIYEFKIE